MRRRSAAAALAVLVLALATTLWIEPWSDDRVNDLYVFQPAAAAMLGGQLPYRDFLFEYPPLAAPVIALPGVLGTGDDAYRLSFAALTLLLAAAMVLLCGALAARTGGDPRRAMLAAAVSPLLCGAMIRTHFDLAPVVLTLVALLLLCGRRPRSGLAVLGLGAMTKVFPLFAAPAALAWLGARAGRRAAASGTVALALAMAIPAAAAVAISPAGVERSARYQLDRPLQIESAPAQVLRVLDWLGAERVRVVHTQRSHGLLHPASGAVSAVFTGLLLALVALLALGAARGGADPPQERRLVLAGLASVVAFAALGRVLSPQFLVWVVPLMALAFAWRYHALAATAAAAILVTLVEFPSRYLGVVQSEPFPVALVIARDALLLGVLWLAARELGPLRAAPAQIRRPKAAAARST